MSHNIKILFWLYKAKAKQSGEAPLMLRVTYNNERKQISTGFTLSPNKWDAPKGKVKGRDEVAVQINSYIGSSIGKLRELSQSMLQQGGIDLNTLLDKFLGRDISPATLLELVQYHNKQVREKLGQDFSLSTLQKYEITQKKLSSFIQFHYRRKDIKLAEVERKFISEFDYYLKTVEKNEHNTSTKYCKNLKRILNVGVANGWLEKSPFEHVQTPYKSVMKVYLTSEELDLLHKKVFRLERLNLVRDLFLLQCYTGLAFADMAKLKGHDVSTGIDRHKWIVIYRKKTHIRSAIPLLPEAMQVIEKYNPSYKETPNAPLLPVYSNQKFNSYLHEIADLCGINKCLTSHVGRRTFATTVGLANGVSIETIAKVLGHSTTKITHQYAIVTDLKVSEEMNNLKEKMRVEKASYE